VQSFSFCEGPASRARPSSSPAPGWVHEPGVWREGRSHRGRRPAAGTCIVLVYATGILFIRQVGRYCTFIPPDVAVGVGCVRTKNHNVRLRFAPAGKPPIGLRCRGRPESIDVVEAQLLTEGAVGVDSQCQPLVYNTHTFLVVVRARAVWEIDCWR